VMWGERSAALYDIVYSLANVGASVLEVCLGFLKERGRAGRYLVTAVRTRWYLGAWRVGDGAAYGGAGEHLHRRPEAFVEQACRAAPVGHKPLVFQHGATQPTLQSSVREVYLLDSGTGKFARITPQSGHVLPVSTEPGKARVYLSSI